MSNEQFGPAAWHMHDEWQALRDEQIEAAIAANRECFDESDYCEVPISRRARWLGRAEDAALAGLCFVSVLALLVAFIVAPLVALAAHIRGSMTP